MVRITFNSGGINLMKINFERLLGRATENTNIFPCIKIIYK